MNAAMVAGETGIRAGPRTSGALRRSWVLHLPRGDSLQVGGSRRALVMGILNVTPDSFSDGGLYYERDAAVARAEEMAGEGADIIDVGGESTRPGAEPVPEEEQVRRVVPVIEAIARRLETPISIDTSRAAVARRALDAGAQIINDVTALRDDPMMAPLAAERGAPVVLMHMKGTPRTMQIDPTYEDVVREVVSFLHERIEAAVSQGVRREQIVVDPGFGFGKTLEHNLELLRRLDELASLGAPILVGTSRKSMLGQILSVGPRDRVFGMAATVAVALERGVEMVRVHDVRAAVHVAKVIAAIQGRAWT